MKKLIAVFILSAAVTALASCGLIDKEEDDKTPDKKLPALTTTAETSVTTAVTSSAEKIKSKKKTTTTEAVTGNSQPVVPLSADKITVKSISSVNTASIKSGSGSSGAGNAAVSAVSDSRAKTPEKTEETEEKSYTDISCIAGSWAYQEMDDETDDFYTVGQIDIDEDGTYCLSLFCEEESRTGKIRLGYEQLVDCDKVPYFAFYENDTDFWTLCNCCQTNPNIFYTGNGGTARLIRSNEMNSDVDFGFLSDHWIYQEKDRSTGEYVTAGRVNIDLYGYYIFYPEDGSTNTRGYVNIEYEEYSDGSVAPYYAFYDEGSDLWISCLCDQIDIDIFYAGNGGSSRLVRINQTEDFFDMSFFADNWEYQELDSSDDEYMTLGYLSIDADGYYTYTSIDGTEQRNGKMRTEAEDYDGYIVYKYGFYDYGKYYWTSCRCQQTDMDAFYFEDDDFSRIERYNTKEIKADDFIGTWNDYRSYLSVTKGNGEYIVTSEGASSATEYYTYEFRCVFDKEKQALICDKKGVCTATIYQDGSYEPTEIVMYTDGSAEFRLKGNSVIHYNVDDDYEVSYIRSIE